MSSEVSDLGRPDICLYLLAKLAIGGGGSWGPETEYVAHFSHRAVYKASLPLRCHSGSLVQFALAQFFPVMATLFPSGMPYITDIQSRYWNSSSFCSELNREHADKDFISIRLIVFEIPIDLQILKLIAIRCSSRSIRCFFANLYKAKKKHEYRNEWILWKHDQSKRR